MADMSSETTDESIAPVDEDIVYGIGTAENELDKNKNKLEANTL